MFGWEFPPLNSGGLGTACQGLTKGLSKHNVKISFVLPRKLNAKIDYLKMMCADINVHCINSLLTPYLSSVSYDQRLFAHEGNGIYGKTLFEEVERYAQKARLIALMEQHDIIHAHDWLTFKAGVIAKEVSGKPLVVHVHATEFDRTGGNGVNQHVYDIEREGMHKADLVIAVSNYTKNKIMEHYNVPANKIRVVHNAVESPDQTFDRIYKLKEKNKIVLFLGRLTLQKGPDYFLYAAKKVLDHYPNVIFLYCGSGDMERFLIEKAAELGISDRVLFAGFVRGSDTEEAYKIADLYVMPSVSEPFGITPLEAAIRGTPSLISKQSGVSEVINHCLKVDFWDIDEMSNKIIAVLNHTELHHDLKENATAEVRHINWENSAKKCIDVYNEVISK